MVLDAICVVCGAGPVVMRHTDGVLTIYIGDYADEGSQHPDAALYMIEPGYTRLYLGEIEKIEQITQQPVQHTLPNFTMEEVT